MSDQHIPVEVSRIHSLDSMKCIGFTHALFNDMLSIYLTLSNSPEGKDAYSFMDTLYYHIRADRDLHGLTIDPLIGGLIQKLYTIYKDKGFPGDIRDMLFAIECNIITAEPYDTQLGYHTTKAVDVYSWDYIFQCHAMKYKCHPHIFEALAPQYHFNHEPTFSFNDLFPEGYELYGAEGYPLTSWNSTNGSWFLEYSFDNRGDIDPIDIITLHGNAFSYIFRMYFEELPTEPYNKAIFTVVEIDHADGMERVRSRLELNTTVLIYEKMVFSYRDNQMFIKGLDCETTIDDLFKDMPHTLTLDVPFGDRARRGIHTFTYYSRYSTKDELLFFLN